MTDKTSTGICTDVRFHRIQSQLVTCGPNNAERQVFDAIVGIAFVED